MSSCSVSPSFYLLLADEALNTNPAAGLACSAAHFHGIKAG